ncbi:hypothetical protein DY000_02001839 [Brassica cretica]|uniref:Protein kinase domain-containing protein n=1 Tax=Brassica cretica TaxID=69181 RepID=A0ABQ7BZA3_BRACR|nr:hypothetical protein DY000_02001839 [Brassica cretica]
MKLRRAPTRSPANSAISSELGDLRGTRPMISDEFGYLQALSGVSFPCVKMFNESPNLPTLIDMNLPPVEVLYFSVFILCAFDQILLDLEAQQGGGDDSKSQVGMFVALAIVLRCKPEALTSVLPTLREDPKDLKPENFLLLNEDENSPLKTIDFGLSDFYKPGDVFKDIVGDAYYIALEALKRKYESEAII